MPGGLASILITQSLDLVSLIATGVGRAATVGFLRLSTLALAQAFDLVTFSLMVARYGTRSEANPIVVDLFHANGFLGVVVAKLALVVLIGALSVASSSQPGGRVWAVVGGLPLALAIAAGLIGGITNTANILR